MLFHFIFSSSGITSFLFFLSSSLGLVLFAVVQLFISLMSINSTISQSLIDFLHLFICHEELVTVKENYLLIIQCVTLRNLHMQCMKLT
jgi:hypothetical protein